ncbi:MAG: DinB family protein [Anaerolineales bacterium]
MTHFREHRPQPDEHLAYYDRYIRLVPEGDVIVTLQRQLAEALALFRALTEAQADARPTPGEWNAKESLGHLTDSERVFAYRALRFARGDAKPLAGFEPLDYIRAAAFDQQPWAALVGEFETVRQATVTLFQSFDETAWARRGLASDNPVSVRALAYIIAGHELEHLAAIRPQV